MMGESSRTLVDRPDEPRLRRVPCLLGLWCAAALATAVPAFGTSFEDPEFLIDVWQTEQGLPEDSATSMVQTPDGYLWFGTFNGLVRFDGVRFSVFDRSNTPQLPSPGIVNLHLDHSGRLWVSTLLGMACVKDGHWTSYGEDSGWIGNYVRFSAETRSGELYFSTYDGKLLHFRGDRFEEVPPPPVPPKIGMMIVVDETDTLWLINPQFIGRRVGNEWKEAIPVAPLLAGDNANRLMPAASRSGGLWIATREALRRYDHLGRQVYEAPKPPWRKPGFWSAHEDSSGGVWVCTHDQGVYHLARDEALDIRPILS